jgi:predicted nucleic acid-binding protein
MRTAGILPHRLAKIKCYDRLRVRAGSLEILIEATPWVDVHRAWTLASGSLRYADALYVAAAERHATALLTADARIERSGAPTTHKIITVAPAD